MDNRTTANLKSLDDLFRQVFKDKPNEFFPDRYGVFISYNQQEYISTPAISVEYFDEKKLQAFNTAIHQKGFTRSRGQEKIITKGEDNQFYFVGLSIDSLAFFVKDVSEEIRQKLMLLSKEEYHMDINVCTFASSFKTGQVMSTHKYLPSTPEKVLETSTESTMTRVSTSSGVTTQTVFQSSLRAQTNEKVSKSAPVVDATSSSYESVSGKRSETASIGGKSLGGGYLG